MLRSFAYARGAAERSLSVRDSVPLERLALWERQARAAYVEAYRASVRGAAIGLVPEDDAAFGRALAAWELDKALYEIVYETRNRPDWLELPLRTFRSESR
jgi:predicted trehalose synthase